ncbi:MAG: response regulator [Elusimicrobia bacterium]|nr:response regulator [Elusimicrobiota bacterium]
MKKKILIVDDDENIIDLLQFAFEAAGYEVVCWPNGTKFIDMVESSRPDLIILDLVMPGIDGYSLQILLDENEATRAIPVIVMTGLPAARGLFEKYPQVKLFVQKPFNTAALVKTAIELCGGN